MMIRILTSLATCLAMMITPQLRPLVGVSNGAPVLHTNEHGTCADQPRSQLPSRHFVFPRDHAAHAGYEVEMWRTFGRVTDDGGKSFDFAVNVSRFEIADSNSHTKARLGGWSARHFITTHFELLDDDTLAIRRGTTVDREDALGAAASEDRLAIVTHSVKYTMLKRLKNTATEFAITLRDPNDLDGLSLEQTPTANVVPLGPGGIMRTGSCVSNDAYAYALPFNATQGTLRIEGVTHRVKGSTWIEHEFAHQELAMSDAGWSRFEVQFDDGRSLDARFARDTNDDVVATSGVYIARDGKVTYLTSGTAETQLPPEAKPADARWHSAATDITYPALWYFLAKPGHLALATVEMTHDQENRASGRLPFYWGAIDVEKYSPPGGDHGHGFVELTGYTPQSKL